MVNLTPTRLPYLHKNARSRQISSAEIREVFEEDVSRGLPRGLDREDYLRKVLP